MSKYEVLSVVDHKKLGRGSDDEAILACCADERWDLVLNDWGIRHNPHQKVVYHQAGIGAFFLYLGKSKTPRLWKILRILAKYWPEVEQRALNCTPPFTYQVHKTKGISKL